MIKNGLELKYQLGRFNYFTVLEVIRLGYVFYNPNPLKKQTSGDCTVRAISKAMKWDWDKTYAALCVYGFMMGEMPSANSVWGSFLLDHGFEEHSLMQKCKNCYNLIQFCHDCPEGEYIVGTEQHIIYVNSGNYFDSWDSGDVIPTYYFKKIEKEENKDG